MKYPERIQRPIMDPVLDIKEIIMSDTAQKVVRPMRYPYTFTAKVAQFPWGHYFKKQWIWKYWALSLALSIPVFRSISNLSNSPGNVAKWAEIRRKEAEEHHH